MSYFINDIGEFGKQYPTTLKILELMVLGHTRKDIAEILGMRGSQISDRLTYARRKYYLGTTYQLIAILIKKDVLDISHVTTY